MRASSTSGPSPIFSSTPGRKLSRSMSADGSELEQRARAPAALCRSRHRLFLLRAVDLPVRRDALGLPGAQRVAGRRLDLDDLGAEVAEHLRQHVAREQPRHVEHAQPSQRPGRSRRVVAPLQSARLEALVCARLGGAAAASAPRRVPDGGYRSWRSRQSRTLPPSRKSAMSQKPVRGIGRSPRVRTSSRNGRSCASAWRRPAPSSCGFVDQHRVDAERLGQQHEVGVVGLAVGPRELRAVGVAEVGGADRLDRREAEVVEQHPEHRNVQLDRRRQRADHRGQAAVADQADHLAVGRAELGADRGGRAKSPSSPCRRW